MSSSGGARGLRGRYEIEREVGHGGMGRVFAARDLKLDREVAIKFLPTGTHGEEELHRFEQEARAAGSLDHPNVLVVHDIGASEEGPYIVSELLQGATLRDRLQGKPLPLATAVDYALQLAQGLRAAHAKGIVHRDLKPENLFITHDGRLKILDFGIAKLLERKDTTAPIDGEPKLRGTLAYMSPEQVHGLGADPRADLFAFGAILYEMLTGRRAFASDSDEVMSLAIVSGQPPELPEHVPAKLRRIVARCLEKDRSDRYQSAADLAVDLAGCLQPSPSPLVHRRLIVMLLAAIAVTLAIPFAKEKIFPRRVERSSIAVLPFANLGTKENEYLSDGITEDLINALANVEGLRVTSRTSSFVFKGKAGDAAEIGRKLKVATLLEGSVRREGNSLRVVAQLVDVGNGFHIWSKTYDRELKSVLAVEDELARSIAEALRPSFAARGTPLVRHTTASTEAHDLYLRGRYFWNDRTEAGLRKAIVLYEQAIAADPRYALAHTGLADSYLLLRSYARMDDPGDWLARARQHAEAALRLDESLAEAHTSLASIAEADFDWKTGEREHRRAIELGPEYARAHHWYGLLLRDLGRFGEAEREVNRALQLDPTSLPIRIMAAAMPYFERNYERARGQLSALLDFASGEQAVGAMLAVIDTHEGKHVEAIAAIDKVVAPEDRDSGWLSVRGYVHARGGDRREALRILSVLEQRERKEYIGPANLALVYTGLGDADRAFAMLERAFQVRDGSLSSLKVEPFWDPLRSDPRLAQFLRRLNLE